MALIKSSIIANRMLYFEHIVATLHENGRSTKFVLAEYSDI